MTVKLQEYTKDLSVTIEFDTDRVAFGNEKLTYFAPKGMSKDEQREYIFNKLQMHKLEIDKALSSYYFTKAGKIKEE